MRIDLKRRRRKVKELRDEKKKDIWHLAIEEEKIEKMTGERREWEKKLRWSTEGLEEE